MRLDDLPVGNYYTGRIKLYEGTELKAMAQRHRCLLVEVLYKIEEVVVLPITTFAGSNPVAYWTARGCPRRQNEYLAVRETNYIPNVQR